MADNFENIFNDYRSITYNFTLAAISPDQLKNPESYRNKKLNLVIAKSGGKGINAMNAAGVVGIKTDIGTAGITKDDDGNPLEIFDKSAGQSLVNTFNKESPGALDLFIDNLELDTLMCPNEETGPAIGTKIRFEIYEPFSVNGFIEALHVSALAAGWGGYVGAAYLLKIEFWGYQADINEPVSLPKKIPADKYIVIKITSAEVEVTEQGTRYRCTGIPINEIAYANVNKLTAQRQMTGNTVRDVLKDLFKGLNEGSEDRADNEKGNPKDRDEYEIYFPEAASAGSAINLNDSEVSKIGKAKINEFLKENAIYKFPPLKDKEDQPNKQYNPTENAIQFAAGSDIVDIITAVIRDSHYLKEILEKVEKEKIDGDGMIDYFQITVNVLPTKLDTASNKQLYKYQYIVVPYKVHFSKLPDQQFNKYDPKRLKELVRRKYDYLYGGRNIDILNFKLNFNNLYFQAANPNMGNKPTNEKSTSAMPSDNKEVTKPAGQAKAASASVNEASSSQVIPEASGQQLRAGPSRSDPYYQLAYNAHQAILESVNLVKGDIDIVGDPFFLCTSGMSNYLPKIKDAATTIDGEANLTAGPVVIRVNFRNPVDLNTDPQSPEYGFLKFRNLAPFSGLFQVVKCHSVFRDGVFKQTLKVIRYQGQLEENANQQEVYVKPYTSLVKTTEATVQDSAPAYVQTAGVRPNEVNLTTLVKNGLPTSGMPGRLSQFISSVPGVGAKLSEGLNFLGQLGSIGLKVGDPLSINTLQSSIRANAVALANITNVAKGASNAVNYLGVAPSGTLLNSVPSEASITAARLTSAVKDSKAVPKQLTQEQLNNITADALAKGIPVEQALAEATIYSGQSLTPGKMTTLANTFNTNNISNAVSGLGQDVSGFFGNVKDKVSNLFTSNSGKLTDEQRSAVIADATAKGVPVDQALRNASIFGVNLPGAQQKNAEAIMASLGLNSSQLSGIVGKDSTIAKQVQTIAEEIPPNTNFAAVKDQGIILSQLSKDTLQNLPATPIKKRDLGPILPDQSVDISKLSKAEQDALARQQAEQIFGKGTLDSASAFGKSVQEKYGSLDASFASRINSLGDPNAPPYTGNDPIVRKRLGLPPLEG